MRFSQYLTVALLANASEVYVPLNFNLPRKSALRTLVPYKFAYPATEQGKCSDRLLEVVFAIQSNLGQHTAQSIPAAHLGKIVSDSLYTLASKLEEQGLSQFADVRYGLITFDGTQAGNSQDCNLQYSSNLTDNALEVGAQFYQTLVHAKQNNATELNNFQALIAGASRINWSSTSTRLIIHVTDAAPRYYDDGLFAASGLRKPSGVISQQACLGEYFPSPEQTASALKSHGVYVTHLIADPKFLQGAAGSAWHLFNRFTDQPDNMVNGISLDISDLATKASSVLEYLIKAECLQHRTTSRRLGEDKPNLRGEATPLVIKHDKDLLVRVAGRPKEFSIKFNGNELVPAARRLAEVDNEPMVIKKKDLVVRVAGRPDNFVVRYNGEDLVPPPVAPARQLAGEKAADPVVIKHDKDLLVKVGGRPKEFSVKFNGQELAPPARRLADAEPLVVKHDKDLLVKVGGRPKEFSVKFNGQELAPPARRLADAEPLVIKHDKDLLVKVAGRPKDFSVKFNGQELAPPARRLSEGAAPVVVKHDKDLLVKVGGRPKEFSVKFNGQELVDAAAGRQLEAANEKGPIVITKDKELYVEVPSRPKEFSVKYHGEELVPGESFVAKIKSLFVGRK